MDEPPIGVAPWLAPSIDRENTTSVANPTFQTLRYSFSSLSILGSLVIIITFIILKQQRRHPHSLVFFMAISDLLYSILNVAQEALGEVYPNPSDTVEVIYFFVTIAGRYFSMASMTWNGMISINMMVAITRPFEDTRSWMTFYHLASWLFPALSVAATIIMVVVFKIRPHAGHLSRFEWETEVPTIMFFLLAICALIFTMARLQTLKGALQYRRAILFRMLLYVIAFAVCWSGETVLSIYLTIVRIDSVDKKTFLALFWWAAVSSCLLGLANAIVWLTTPTFYRAARQANCCSKRKKQRNADHESLLRPGEFDAPSQDEDEKGLQGMNLTLRKNILTCVLLGIQHGLASLMKENGVEGLDDGVDDAEVSLDGDHPPRRKRMLHITSPKKVPNSGSSTPGGSFGDLSAITNSTGSEGSILDSSSPPSETIISIVEEKSVQKLRPISVRGRENIDASSTSDSDADDLIGEFYLARNSTHQPTAHKKPLKERVPLLKMLYQDYRSMHEYELAPQVESSEVGIDGEIFVSKFQFVEVAPKAFFNIRLASGIEPADFYYSLNPIEFIRQVLQNQKFSDGRSGSFFCFSPDRKFIIKTIPDVELETLVTILPYYYTHLMRYPTTLLMRIWGCYQVNIMRTQLNIIIISNVFVNAGLPTPVHETYDLKGSFVDRKTPNPDKAKVLKDSDLKYQFKIDDERRVNLIQQLKLDSNLLRGLNIMDYSLLVGVHYLTDEEQALITDNVVRLHDTRKDIMMSSDGEAIYCFGVIDILQPYNASKKMERFLKVYLRCKNRDGISSTHPNKYQRRFMMAMSRSISK